MRNVRHNKFLFFFFPVLSYCVKVKLTCSMGSCSVVKKLLFDHKTLEDSLMRNITYNTVFFFSLLRGKFYL